MLIFRHRNVIFIIEKEQPPTKWLVYTTSYINLPAFAKITRWVYLFSLVVSII